MNTIDLIPIYSEPLYSIQNIEKIEIITQGNFQKKVMILIAHSEWNAENELFTKKVLQSCGLTENDYLIIFMQPTFPVLDIIKKYHPEILFSFGIKIESEKFHLHKSLYRPFLFNKIKIVLCDDVNLLKNNKEKRLELWNRCIKPLFNIQ